MIKLMTYPSLRRTVELPDRSDHPRLQSPYEDGLLNFQFFGGGDYPLEDLVYQVTYLDVADTFGATAAVMPHVVIAPEYHLDMLHAEAQSIIRRCLTSKKFLYTHSNLEIAIVHLIDSEWAMGCYFEGMPVKKGLLADTTIYRKRSHQLAMELLEETGLTGIRKV